MRMHGMKGGTHLHFFKIALWLAILLLPAAAQQAPAASSALAETGPAEFAQARKLLREGKPDEAIAQLQALEARDPATKGLALELGSAHYKKGDYPKAIDYLKKATAADSANEEATQ